MAKARFDRPFDTIFSMQQGYIKNDSQQYGSVGQGAAKLQSLRTYGHAFTVELPVLAAAIAERHILPVRRANRSVVVFYCPDVHFVANRGQMDI